METWILLIITSAVIILLASFILLRRNRIGSKAFVLWFLIALLMISYSFAPSIIFTIQVFLGTQFVFTAMMLVSVVFLLMISFFLYLKVSSQEVLLKKLAQRIAFLERDVASTTTSNTKDPE